jgi:hypothetical protein
LIDAVFVSSTLDDSECDSIGYWITNLVVGMDEIDDAECIRLEFVRVQTPLTHLVEEVGITAPILKALEITIEARA